MVGIHPENRIAEVRARLDLTLTEVAKKARTTAAQVQKLENGERRTTITWLRRLAKALDVTVVELLPDEDVPVRLDGAEAKLIEYFRQVAPRERQRVMAGIAAYFEHEPTG